MDSQSTEITFAISLRNSIFCQLYELAKLQQQKPTSSNFDTRKEKQFSIIDDASNDKLGTISMKVVHPNESGHSSEQSKLSIGNYSPGGNYVTEFCRGSPVKSNLPNFDPSKELDLLRNGYFATKDNPTTVPSNFGSLAGCSDNSKPCRFSNFCAGNCSHNVNVNPNLLPEVPRQNNKSNKNSERSQTAPRTPESSKYFSLDNRSFCRPPGHTPTPPKKKRWNRYTGDFQCPQCEHKTTRKQYLLDHMLNTHSNMFLNCNLCAFKTKRKTNLQLHYSRIHKKNAEESKEIVSKTKFVDRSTETTVLTEVKTEKSEEIFSVRNILRNPKILEPEKQDANSDLGQTQNSESHNLNNFCNNPESGNAIGPSQSVSELPNLVNFCQNPSNDNAKNVNNGDQIKTESDHAANLNNFCSLPENIDPKIQNTPTTSNIATSVQSQSSLAAAGSTVGTNSGIDNSGEPFDFDDILGVSGSACTINTSISELFASITEENLDKT